MKAQTPRTSNQRTNIRLAVNNCEPGGQTGDLHLARAPSPTPANQQSATEEIALFCATCYNSLCLDTTNSRRPEAGSPLESRAVYRDCDGELSSRRKATASTPQWLPLQYTRKPFQEQTEPCSSFCTLISCGGSSSVHHKTSNRQNPKIRTN